MPRSLTEALKQEPEKFVGKAWQENPNIQDFRDFVNALNDAFNTERGRRASKFFNDEETKILFESDENKDKLKEKLSKKEYDKLFEELEKEEFEVIREKSKGQEGKIKSIFIKKDITIKSYKRSGIEIKGYAKGYNKWTYPQRIFIVQRKMQGLKPKQVIYEYNKHFYQNPRSSSSIKTYLYREA